MITVYGFRRVRRDFVIGETHNLRALWALMSSGICVRVVDHGAGLCQGRDADRRLATH